MKATHTGSMTQDRKQYDACQTPAGGPDSTAACSEPCSRNHRETLTGRRTDLQIKNNVTYWRGSRRHSQALIHGHIRLNATHMQIQTFVWPSSTHATLTTCTWQPRHLSTSKKHCTKVVLHCFEVVEFYLRLKL